MANMVNVGYEDEEKNIGETLRNTFDTGWMTESIRSSSPIIEIAPGSSYSISYDYSITADMLAPENGAKDLFIVYGNNFDALMWFPVPENVRETTTGKVIALGFSMWQMSRTATPEDFNVTLRLDDTRGSFTIRVTNNFTKAIAWWYENYCIWTQRIAPTGGRNLYLSIYVRHFFT